MDDPDDLLDRYALGQVTDEGQLARIEEHLLVCEKCSQAETLAGQLRALKKPAN